MSAPSVLVQALQAHDRQPESRSAAHLAEYSFRFDDAAPIRPSLPDSGMDWTAAQTLAECRRRGARIDRSSRGLRLRHAHRLPQLAVAVARHERVVGAWLDLGGASAPAHGWDDETDLLVRHLRQRPAPARPVELRPGVSVTDWARFLGSVEGRFAQGPDAPSAPGLVRDVRDAFAQAGAADVRRMPVRSRARAA